MIEKADWGICIVLFGLAASICIFSGPSTIDAVDGPEFAVAGMRLEIPHSPGYPLLMWILRASGGRTYQELRLVTCVIAGLASGVLFLAFRSYGNSRGASAAVSALLVFSRVVLSELNILEVHGLSLLLASAAVALRNTRMGPYAFGMSLFGGHPLSVFLLPMVISRRWRRHWYLVLLPLTLWLYVPLRASSASVMHYGSPEGLSDLYRYLTMYGGRLTAPSLEGLHDLIRALGPVATAVFVVGSVFSRFSLRTAASIAGMTIVFLVYGIPDICSYSWIFLLPIAATAAKGFARLLNEKRILVGVLLSAAVSVSAASGIQAAYNRRNDSIMVITADLLRGIPYEGALCSTGGTSYYAAYMMENEDRRPDLLAVDTYGMVYPFSIIQNVSGRIPAELAGRTVHATAAWGVLPPSGILFSNEVRLLEWDNYDVFSRGMEPSEEMAADMLAEIWCIRALQEESHEAALQAMERAAEYAASDEAISAVSRLSHRFHGGSGQW